MMINLNLDKFRIVHGYILKVYIYTYFLYELYCMILPAVAAVDAGNPVLYLLFSISGIILLSFDLLLNYKCLRNKEFLFPTLFILVSIISVLVNYKYDFVSNVKLLCLMMVQFTCFYATRKKEFDSEQTVSSLMKIFTLVWFVCVVVSLWQYVIGYGEWIDIPSLNDARYRRVGFCEERLFGVFGDPNYAALISIVSAVLGILSGVKKGAKRRSKIFAGVNLVFQWLYIVLSGSRTAILSLIAACFIMCFFAWFRYMSRKENKVVRNASMALLIAGVCSISIFGVQTVTQKVMVTVPTFFSNITSSNAVENANGLSATQETEGEVITGDNEKEFSNVNDANTEISLQREDVVNSEDISNNRFKIWKDALLVWKSSPIVGATARGYLDYAKDKFGDIYIVERQYAIHNGYISTLVFSGVLGAVVIVAWMTFVLIRVFKYLFSQVNFDRNQYIEVVCMFAILAALAVGALTLSMIFYSTMFIDVLFWLICGYILMLTKKERTKENVA